MEKRFILKIKIIGIFLLFIAIPELPYGYYTFLRWAITFISILVAFNYFNSPYSFWGFLFLIVVILFNPFVPVYFDKEIWIFIDFIVGIFMIISIFFPIRKT